MDGYDWEGAVSPHRVPVRIGERTVYVEAVSLEDEEEVAARLFALDDFAGSIGAVTDAVVDGVSAGLRKVRPNKVAVEFGCEIGVESGKLTAILVKGTAKANVKVTMEWTPGAESG